MIQEISYEVKENYLRDKEKCAGSIMLQKKEEVRLYK